MDIYSTATSAPNIALVKYWGKRDDLLKLSINDSLSITLDSAVLASRTHLVLSDRLKADTVFFGGKRVADPKIAEWLMLVRRRLGKSHPAVRRKVLVITSNNFPTSAGIASSASGFAALARAMAGALGIEDRREISILARLGSGSASRSIYGGFVRWKAGKRKDGEDSYAVPVKDEKHWPQIRDVIAIVDAGQKKVSSKDGMERTMATSELIGARFAGAERRVRRLAADVGKRDFAGLAEATMRDSNSMHATMLDTWPPVMYLNDASRRIMEAVHEMNGEGRRGAKAAYTFDAGPNAHIITRAADVGRVKRMLSGIEGVKEVIVSPSGPGARLLRCDDEEIDCEARRLGVRI